PLQYEEKQDEVLTAAKIDTTPAVGETTSQEETSASHNEVLLCVNSPSLFTIGDEDDEDFETVSSATASSSTTPTQTPAIERYPQLPLHWEFDAETGLPIPIPAHDRILASLSQIAI